MGSDFDLFTQEMENIVSNNNTTSHLVAICSLEFFNKLLRHWKMMLVEKMLKSFENESVRICAVKKNGKKWKCTGLTTGKVVYFKRTNKLNNGEDLCWISVYEN